MAEENNAPKPDSVPKPETPAAGPAGPDAKSQGFNVARLTAIVKGPDVTPVQGLGMIKADVIRGTADDSLPTTEDPLVMHPPTPEGHIDVSGPKTDANVDGQKKGGLFRSVVNKLFKDDKPQEAPKATPEGAIEPPTAAKPETLAATAEPASSTEPAAATTPDAPPTAEPQRWEDDPRYAPMRNRASENYNRIASAGGFKDETPGFKDNWIRNEAQKEFQSQFPESAQKYTEIKDAEEAKIIEANEAAWAEEQAQKAKHTDASAEATVDSSPTSTPDTPPSTVEPATSSPSAEAPTTTAQMQEEFINAAPVHEPTADERTAEAASSKAKAESTMPAELRPREAQTTEAREVPGGGTKTKAEYDSAQPQDFSSEDFVSYGMISKALTKGMNENDPAPQAALTKEYAYILVPTNKMKKPPEDWDKNQMGANMNISRGGREGPSAYGEGASDGNKPTLQRMKDVEDAGFVMYRAKLVDGKVPDDASFTQITMKPEETAGASQTAEGGNQQQQSQAEQTGQAEQAAQPLTPEQKTRRDATEAAIRAKNPDIDVNDPDLKKALDEAARDESGAKAEIVLKAQQDINAARQSAETKSQELNGLTPEMIGKMSSDQIRALAENLKQIADQLDKSTDPEDTKTAERVKFWQKMLIVLAPLILAAIATGAIANSAAKATSQ
jgi:hypothetical protein